MDELPPGWAAARFADLGEIRLGKMLDKAKNTGVPSPYLRNINVRWFRFDLDDLHTIHLSEDERETLSIRDGDLLICEGGEPGRAAVWRSGPNNLTFQKALHRMRVTPGITPELVMYRLRADAYSGRLREAFTGTTIKHLTGEGLARYPIVIPPSGEQTRLARKITSVLTHVHACRKRLDRVPQILKKFREAVLDAAVSGRLTEEWRKSHGLDLHWPRTAIADVAEARLGKMLDQAKNEGTLTPYLRNVNVRWFAFDLSDIKELKISRPEASQLLVDQGDVLICEGGEPGRCAVWHGPRGKYVYQKALHRVRVGSMVRPEWICYAIKNAANTGRLADNFTGTTIKHLTGVALAKFALALPPVAEQLEAIRRVEQLFALADSLQHRYIGIAHQVKTLTPAVLAKAFRGELVPQDPNDESAGEMLERIREAQAGETGGAGPRGRPVKRGAAGRVKAGGGRRRHNMRS